MSHTHSAQYRRALGHWQRTQLLALGYSLVELAIVLSITAIAASLALPSLGGVLRQFQLRAATAELYSAINTTRALAMSRGSTVFLIPADKRDWRTGWLIATDIHGGAVLKRHPALPESLRTSTNMSSNTLPLYIAYNGAGRSCMSTNSLAAHWGTLTLKQDGEIRRIKINMLGRARVCNPARDGATCGGNDA